MWQKYRKGWGHASGFRVAPILCLAALVLVGCKSIADLPAPPAPVARVAPVAPPTPALEPEKSAAPAPAANTVTPASPPAPSPAPVAPKPAPVASHGSTVVLESVHVSKPMIALTMDLGETATRASTQSIIDYLAAHHMHCTFFVTGWFVRTFPDLVAEIAKQGHDFGNHTDKHPHCTEISSDRLRKELTTVEQLMTEQSLAISTPKYWRPPFGEYNKQVVQTAAELGYTTVMWSATSVDYNATGDAHHEAARILKRAAPGGIILCHTGPVSQRVIPLVVDALLAKGYTFTTLQGLVDEGKAEGH
jgi:peptidoglycan/xylan/chitin deacetylase (PgdA/CDA1 family)